MGTAFFFWLIVLFSPVFFTLLYFIIKDNNTKKKALIQEVWDQVNYFYESCDYYCKVCFEEYYGIEYFEFMGKKLWRK